MKTEFMAAITQLASERNLSREVVLEALEAALVSAYKKEVFTADQEVAVKIEQGTGEIRVYLVKTVSETVADPEREITQADARKIRSDAAIGDFVEIESTPKGAGRIAAQIARQVVLQRLREAEHHATFEQFVGKEGELVTGNVHFAQPNAVYVNLGRREAILPLSEQLPNERYHAGQQLKFYLLQASQEGRGPRVMLSRSHPNLLRRLFEIEIPEVHGGVVEIRAIARDPGHRSKVAVSSRQQSVEPVGCCLGPRGIRLQSVTNQLNGEKIDVIEWDEDPVTFIANALSPAQVGQISLDETMRTATVIVQDKQLSLAIGRGGQNARLAAKLTGWRIDIKSTSAAEAEHIATPEPEEVAIEPEPVAVEAETITAEPETPAPLTAETAVSPKEPARVEKKAVDKEQKADQGKATITPPQSPEPVPASPPPPVRKEESTVETLDQLLASEVFRFAEDSGKQGQSVLRFAEDILPSARRGPRNDRGKSKGKKKKTYHEQPDEP
ncbi:MAG: transcription termination/antitermination protein NusA [Dehalococcoidia bacterium]|nr:transcription termination/antitermination protein NusA [Dehalococcoidia bacterium]